MDKIIEEVKDYIKTKNPAGSMVDEVELEQAAAAKINGILSVNSEYDGEVFNEIAKSIHGFMDSGEVQKRQLYDYCLDFIDHSGHKPVKTEDGTINHAFLRDDEINKLYNFVKTHKNNKSFGDAVYEIMNKYDLAAPQVYKKAMLSRQDFSRITMPQSTGVKKSTVWNVIVGLGCTLEEADYLLFSAGYVRRQNDFDLTLEYFIKHKNFDIMAINEVLYELGQKTLSCYRPVNDRDVF